MQNDRTSSIGKYYQKTDETTVERDVSGPNVSRKIPRRQNLLPEKMTEIEKPQRKRSSDFKNLSH